DPDYVEARFNLARALAEQGQLDAAAGQYEEALRIAPDHIQTHFNYALLLQRSGQTARAAGHFRHAGDVLTKLGEAEAAAECFGRAEAALTLVENPWFRHWSGFEKGTAVTTKSTTTYSTPTGLAGPPQEAITTTTLMEKRQDKVVLEIVRI